ncbi:hypothetical protein JCM30471_09460 [Desulfuromonas carbonis]|uniref:cupin domain-containing protein n=1 Tax=Desulfuromonas sp. DDH964 TaxID=1823759 RepID=UPI00078E3856|nr:cupin domain-containing protein [Desulfuromonas sp. DDH964]AMV72431.1 hypothetical protein DBW_2089 [Desulfuromonas sp. DDH964]
MKNLVCILLLALFWATPAVPLEAPGIKAQQLAKSTRSWNGEPLSTYPSGQPEVTILRITIPPGAKLPRHEHPVINAGVLLKGELTVVADNGQTLHLKAGDPIVEVVETWHYGRNEGTEPAEILVFYAGVVGTPITIKETTNP